MIYDSLEHKVNPLVREITKGKTSVIFIDAKSAFDSVSWRKLRQRMTDARYPKDIINTIEALYSKAHTTPSLFKDRAKINRGVLQWGILSPTLFNLYIDSLLKELKRDCEINSYADDLAVITKGKVELKKVLSTI